MSAFASVLLNVLFALIATVVVLGPVAAMIWYSWRNVVAAAMVFTALGLASFLIFAAGMTLWSPSASPLPYLAVAVVVCAGLGYGAWRVANGIFVVRLATVFVSVLALSWTIAGWRHVSLRWRVVGNTSTAEYMLGRRERDSLEGERQRSADELAETVMRIDSARWERGLDADAPHPARDGFLMVEDASGAPQRLTFREDLDVALVGESRYRTHRKFLALIADDRLSRYLEGRELVLLTMYHGDERIERTRGVRVLRLPSGAPVTYGMTPGFLDPSSGMFRHGPYRWMKDVLGVPKAERDSIYSKHLGKVPE